MSALLPDNPQLPEAPAVNNAERARGPRMRTRRLATAAGLHDQARSWPRGLREVYYALSDAGKEIGVEGGARNLDDELRGVTQCLNSSIRTWSACTTCGRMLKALLDRDGVRRRRTFGRTHRRHPQGLPADEALRIVRGIRAPGPAYLHDNGIVASRSEAGEHFRRKRNGEDRRLRFVEGSFP